MSRRKPLAVGPAPVSPGARTRRRDRARSERRRERRRESTSPRVHWLRWMIASLLALASVGAGLDWLVHTSLFRVRHVEVIGLRHESRGAVLAASGLAGEPPLLDVNATQVAQRLSVFPWIRAVVVSKRWPNTVELRVRERTPVAVAFDANHTLQFVDASGHDLGPAPLAANLPTLQYLHPLTKSWPFRRAGFNAAFVASRLPKAFSSQVSVITVDAQGSVSLKMTTPVTFVLGPPTDLTDKFVSVASVIAHSQLQPGDSVDVRVPGELAVSGPSSG